MLSSTTRKKTRFSCSARPLRRPSTLMSRSPTTRVQSPCSTAAGSASRRRLSAATRTAQPPTTSCGASTASRIRSCSTAATTPSTTTRSKTPLTSAATRSANSSTAHLPSKTAAWSSSSTDRIRSLSSTLLARMFPSPTAQPTAVNENKITARVICAA